jgi:hypothetical protein
MTKANKLELEIMAIMLWWQNFGHVGMSSDSDRVYMGGKLKKLKDELNNLKNK